MAKNASKKASKKASKNANRKSLRRAADRADRRKTSGKKALEAASAASDGVFMVIEGDSWERLPDWGPKRLPIVGGSNYDLARALAKPGRTLENLAYWGDTIEEIAQRLDFIQALGDTRAPYFLLGGGGNDLLQDGSLRKYLVVTNRDNLKPADYLKPEFEVALRRVMKNYEICLDALDIHGLKPKVILHGYDYAQPMELGWIGEPMRFMGIDDLALQQAIVNVMMDRFNVALKKVAKDRKRVKYVDLRGTVGNDWHDELHPSRAGFERVALKIEAAL